MFGTTSELLTNSKQTLPKLQHEKPSKYLYNSFFAKGSVKIFGDIFISTIKFENREHVLVIS